MARPKNELPAEKRTERLVFKSEVLSQLEIPLQSVITSIRTIADNVRKEEEMLQEHECQSSKTARIYPPGEKSSLTVTACRR